MESRPGIARYQRHGRLLRRGGNLTAWRRRLFAQIEREFHKRISLVTLLQRPTIRALGEHLRVERLATVRNHIFPIQPDGTRTPLFLQTGQPHIWRPLARLLGAQQPVYGLFFPEFSSLPNPFTVSDVAANLIEALREVQPSGPYCLGGWCRSGVIVYEMAQQLRARGEEVRLIVLFDTYSPPYLRSFRGLRALPIRLYFLGEKIVFKIRGDGARATLEIVTRRIRALFARPWAMVSQIGSRRASGRDGDERTFGVQDQFLAVEGYDPAPYDGRLLLFRSSLHQTGRFRDPELGWGKLVRAGLDVQETPGDHHSMFVEPAVQVVAEKLAQSLNQATAHSPGNRSQIPAVSVTSAREA